MWSPGNNTHNNNKNHEQFLRPDRFAARGARWVPPDGLRQHEFAAADSRGAPYVLPPEQPVGVHAVPPVGHSRPPKSHRRRHQREQERFQPPEGQYDARVLRHQRQVHPRAVPDGFDAVMGGPARPYGDAGDGHHFLNNSKVHEDTVSDASSVLGNSDSRAVLSGSDVSNVQGDADGNHIDTESSGMEID